jgi:ureidoglycolate dehydrogenase (NAD+)
MSGQDGKKRIPAAALRAFAAELLVSGGFSPSDAAKTADLLVWANARGVASHGVMRIPRYIEMVELSLIKPDAKPHFASTFGATAVLEGGNAPGAVVMSMAMARATELAGKFGIGWCSARNITHAGAVGYFAEEAARSGRIGIAMTASKPLMSYYGAKAEGVSTNPLAIGVPNPLGGNPILLDMSTSAAALGKIMAAKEAGTSIPVGWGVDANGADTTDPKALKFLLPMAGPKGSGLSLMIEVLCSVLVGNPLIARALSGDGKGSFNGLAMSLSIEAFGDVDQFHRDIADLGNAIKALPKADGVSELLLPGERGYVQSAKTEATGIVLAAGTAASLVKTARARSVAVPEALM